MTFILSLSKYNCRQGIHLVQFYYLWSRERAKNIPPKCSSLPHKLYGHIMEFHSHPCFCVHLHLRVCIVLSTGIPCEENILPSTPSMSHGQFLALLHRFPQSHFLFYFSIFTSVNVGILFICVPFIWCVHCQIPSQKGYAHKVVSETSKLSGTNVVI